MKIQSMRNFTKDVRRGAILVEAPIPDSRGRAKELNRGGNPLANITALVAITLLIVALAYLGFAAYREVEQARRLNEAYQLTVKRASSRDDVAVCKLGGAEALKEIPALPLDQGVEPAKIGQSVTTISFPAGADRLLSVLPEKAAKRLVEQYGEEGPSLINQLARRNIVKPLTSQGHVMDLYDDRIVYDGASGEGSSGAPVFGPSGRVIGIHFAYFEQNRLSNYAIPIGRGLELLRQAGWEPAN